MEFILGIIVLVVSIYALIKIWSSAVPTLNKVLWSLLILILPVIGLIIWFIAGPKGGTRTV